jgi:ATP/ADP translocase
VDLAGDGAWSRAAVVATGTRRRPRLALRYVLGSRLLVWMTLAAVLFSVLFYSLFLPWATAAAERYPTADGVAAFIGLLSAITTGAAFLVSTGATNRLFVRFGIALMVLILPSCTWVPSGSWSSPRRSRRSSGRGR